MATATIQLIRTVNELALERTVKVITLQRVVHDAVEREKFNAENLTGSTILKGSAVAYHASGSRIQLADADTIPAIGITNEEIATGYSGEVLLFGQCELSDWTDIIGTTNLTPNANYFLSDTAGKLSTSPAGSYSQQIGKAYSTTILTVNINRPIKL